MSPVLQSLSMSGQFPKIKAIGFSEARLQADVLFYHTLDKAKLLYEN